MTHPVRNIELIKIFANAFVIWLVVMGFWPLDNTQQAVTLTMLMAGINAVGGYLQNRQTTPLAAPQDEDGVPLVRAAPGAVNAPTNSQMRSMLKK